MREIRIAIISQNSELSRFFELEALNFGFKPSVFHKSGADISGFDVCVIDSALNVRSLGFGGITVIVGEKREDITYGNEKMYLTYPTSLFELQKVYTKIMLGRDNGENFDENNKKCFFDKQNNLISYCGAEIKLSEYEIKILDRLCRSNGNPVSREELNALLGASGGNIADVYICRLRKKLETVNSKRLIFTVRGQGYKIVTDMEWK